MRVSFLFLSQFLFIGSLFSQATGSCAVDYHYSKDEQKLLLEKSTSEGLSILYSYVPESRLLSRELHFYVGQIQERFFHFYNEKGHTLMAITDDGSGEEASDLTNVTYRKVKTFEVETDPALLSFGKPKQILDSYLYEGKLIPLIRTAFEYDDRGCETKRKIFDSKDAFCYEIVKEYDLQSRLIQESNPLGQLTSCAYDEHGNKVEEELIGSGKKIAYAYDEENRLIRKKELHKNECFTTHYAYNKNGQLISEKDPYGNETTYLYDQSGNQIQRAGPYMEDGEGIFRKPAIEKTYNHLGQLITQTDEGGFTTQFAYHPDKNLSSITYPDGSCERFIYYPCGKLKQKWRGDGTSICYTYDAKERLLKESLLDQKGSLLKKEENEYKGALLQSKKDAKGLTTFYRYDGNGRKVEEKSGLKTIRYAYDDFGNLIFVDREGRREYFQYDWLGRLIEKNARDAQGSLYAREAYEYDLQGNQIKKTIWLSQDECAVYCSQYDSKGRLVWSEDSLGRRTERRFSDQHVNGIGQQVQCRTFIDPLGRETREADDAYGRLANRDSYFEGRLAAWSRFDYDARGNLTRKQVVVMDEGLPIREFAHLYEYNSLGLLKSETEMPQAKITLYDYDRMGRLIEKQKPDGVKILYSYDTLGRLIHLASNDGTVAYSYAYDPKDNLIEIQDHIHLNTQRRAYDEWNRMIQEEISPGILMQYRYDAHDRLTRMILPDQSLSLYHYDAFHLKKIERFDAGGQHDYQIRCEEYDLRGNLLKCSSPAGAITFKHDPLGRQIAIQACSFESHLSEFDQAGNLLRMSQKDPSGILQSQFAYDRFNCIIKEATVEYNEFAYDSIGICLKKNGRVYSVNESNQIVNDGQSEYVYDLNGNLTAQFYPPALFTYDALDRLTGIETEGKRTVLQYDAFGRCIKIIDGENCKHVMYQGNHEIGSYSDGKMNEFRLVHPESGLQTFSIELQGEPFFPIQDYRGSICALQQRNGALVQWTRYSAFGNEAIYGVIQEGVVNPWRFLGKRKFVP